MKTKPSIQPPIALKTILDILYGISIVGLIIKIIFTIMYFFFDLSAPLTLSMVGTEITEYTTPVLIGICLKIVISAAFIYIIYLLREVVRSFFKKKLFTPLQISGLHLIGRLIILTALAEVAINFILIGILKSKVEVKVDSSFNSIWFILAVGLFFILLSKSFKYASSLQEENELTV